MPIASPGDVREAIARARKAHHEWEKTPFSERSRIIRDFHDRILTDHDRILNIIQSESGKARRDAFAELVTVAGTARYYAAHGGRHLQVRRRLPAVPAITSAEVLYKPHGVVGLITPWNYPFLLGIADALPALLAGNAVVIKPSELTPLSATVARDLLVESGLNPDLAIVIHGPADVGAELIDHVDYVGFTGGTETGRKIAVRAAERLIPYSLELGGKNPIVVLDGAPLSEAANGLLAGAFFNSGQTCISVERAYVQDSIFDEFVSRVLEKTANLKLGWSPSWDVDMGSLISTSHAQKVLSRIQQAASNGARILAGGKPRPDLGPAFVEPTILTNVTDDMPISSEETFGPVITLHAVRTAEEAIERANKSRFGLNASVWSRRESHAREVARRLATGSVGINSTLLIYNSFDVPMGGVKESGIGRRHAEHGILRYTQAQSIVSSIAWGGGYDSLLLRTKSERMAKAIMTVLKVWRRVPWL